MSTFRKFFLGAVLVVSVCVSGCFCEPVYGPVYGRPVYGPVYGPPVYGPVWGGPVIVGGRGGFHGPGRRFRGR